MENIQGWTKVASYARMEQLDLVKTFLDSKGIETSVIKEKGSAFLLGEIELFVKKEQADEAQKLIQDFKNSLIE